MATLVNNELFWANGLPPSCWNSYFFVISVLSFCFYFVDNVKHWITTNNNIVLPHEVILYFQFPVKDINFLEYFKMYFACRTVHTHMK